jgi:hypothetical protein
LDGYSIVTIAGNTTLTGLSNGNHNIVAYTTDLAGHVTASETIIFTISKLGLGEPEPNEGEVRKPEPTEQQEEFAKHPYLQPQTT